MRKSWIAAGIVLVIVGVAAAYRLGGGGSSHESPGFTVQGSGEPGVTRFADAKAGSKASAGPQSAVPAGSTPTGSGDGKAAEATGSKPIALHHYVDGDAPPRSESNTAYAAPPPVDNAPVAPAPARTAPVVAPPAAPQRVAPSVPAATVPQSVPSPSRQDPVKTDAPATSPDDPNSDRHPPVLQFLRFDPPEVQDGGVAVLSIGASDDLSGVKSVFGTIRSPSEAAVVPFVGLDAGGGGVFTTSVSIPKKAETGNWFVGTLQITDRANNPLNASFVKGNVPPGGVLHVVSAESDSTAPTVHRVSLAKPTVAGGERNQIEVDVDDDSSGVASVNGTFQSPSKVAFIPFSCTMTTDGVWGGAVPVPPAAECGQWTLRNLRVTDKANNAAVLAADSPLLAGVGFAVSGGGACDSEPPTIDSVYVAPNAVSTAVASEVTITIMAHDDGSGVAQLTGRVEGPIAASGQAPRIFFSAQPDPRSPDAPMVVKITVPPQSGVGIWRIAVIEITDKAHNTRPYYATDPALANATFTVQ